MRRLAALVVTLSLTAIIVDYVGQRSSSGAALALGVALVSASIVGWLCQFVRLPRITGYLAVGLLAGPSVANLITDSMARDLQAASNFAVVVIALLAGLQLNKHRLGDGVRTIVLSSVVTLVATWVGLAVSLYLVWPWLPIAPDLPPLERAVAAGLAATLLAGASPAVTVAVIAESRARGPLSSLATGVVVTMEVAVLVLLTVWREIVAFVWGTEPPNVLALAVAASWSAVGSLAFGVIVGGVLTLYLKFIGRETTVMLLAACAVLSGAAPLGLEPFLAGLAAGLVVQNATPVIGDLLHDAIERAAMPVLVLFFAAVGASMHIEAVATIGVVAVGLAALRVFWIQVSIRVAVGLAGVTTPAVSVLWRALVPTAGATLGLAAIAVLDLPDWAPRMQALIVAVVAITQLVGPIIFRATLNEVGEIRQGGGHLVVVSNREPWVHERDENGAIKARPTPGGVSVALDALMRDRGGVWIAHGAGGADRDVVDEHNSVEVPPDAPAYRLRRLWLSTRQEEGYYGGFSNSALWPLCHQAHVRPVFKDDDWEAYQEVNRLFANAVALEAPPDSSVFLNDYHLALVAKYLRKERPLLRTALFWHIPWPDVDRLRICPWRRELVEGLMANDLLAFQLPRDQRNFLTAVQEDLGASLSGDTIYLGGREVRVLAIPIGADFDRIREILAEETLASEMATLSRELDLHGRLVGIGVDRLDYTKGIPERIAAVARLLRERPDLQRRLLFLQIGVPSREEVPGYAEISAEIDGLVAKVNLEFGRNADDGPIRYLKRGFQLPQLVALYRLADFCVVSSLHDGMNLVAKEFVAARDDLDGVLILSELAGAAEELSEALIINPYDERGFSGALERATGMPVWERRRRMQALRRRVAGRDVLAWASDILDRLERRKGRGFLSG